MARYLTAGVLVERPGHGAVFLAPDSELPEWAVDLVGDHVLSDAEDEPEEQEAAPVRRGRAKATEKATEKAVNKD